MFQTTQHNAKRSGCNSADLTVGVQPLGGLPLRPCASGCLSVEGEAPAEPRAGDLPEQRQPQCQAMEDELVPMIDQVDSITERVIRQAMQLVLGQRDVGQ